MISRVPGGPWVMLFLVLLFAALLTALWSDRMPLSAGQASADSNGPARGKSRIRETDSESLATRKRAADPKLVQQWLDELLERHPEAKPEKRDVPDHENGHLAWVEYSREMMDDIELPDCLSHYVTEPTPENRKCAEEWLNQHKHIGDALVAIGAIRQQSMEDDRFDTPSTPGVKNVHKAFYMMLAYGLIAADDGNEALARSKFDAAMGLVRQMDGIEASSLIGRVIATGSRTVIHKTFLDRIYPSIAKDADRLSAWRDTLAPDNTRDGLTRALIGTNLRDTSLLISAALSGEFNSITELDASNAEIKLLTNAQFGMNAKAISALKAGSALDSIPAIYAQPMDRVGLSDENHVFLTDHMETMQDAMAGILKKETRLMMYDAALAAAMGVEIPVDPVSGKPFQWDETTMTLSAPEGSPPLEPIILPFGN